MRPGGIDGRDESYISQSSGHAPDSVLCAANLSSVCVCVFECVHGLCVSLSKGIDSEAKSERERESTRNCDSGKVLS